MAVRKKAGNVIPLIVEEHPDSYQGYPFITLIQYRKQFVLTIVDNSDEASIRGYVLDLCGPEQVNEELLLTVASEWYDSRKGAYPVSVEFSRKGIARETSKLYRTYSIEFVTRVIGPLPRFEMTEIQRVKRRKRRPIPQGIEVETHKIVQLPY